MAAPITVKDNPIKSFFGPVDRIGKREDGNISSFMPSYTNRQKVMELEEDIRKMRYSLEHGLVTEKHKGDVKKMLARFEGILSDIREGTPKFTGAQLDRLKKFSDHFINVLRDAMPHKDVMEYGQINVGDQNSMDFDQTWGTSVGEFGDIFEANGIKPLKGKVARAQVAHMLKLANFFLDRPTNMEAYRRGYPTGVFRSGWTMQEMGV